MNTKQMDGGMIQDLYHHSLAMMGKENGVDAHTLRDRLDSGERARELLGALEGEVYERFDPVRPEADYDSEAKLVAAGKALNDAVCEWALLCMIDPNTGEGMHEN